MKKLILSLLLALSVAGASHAQSLGPGRCAFPNCTTGDEDATYTPTTDSNWTAWGASSYATLKTALDNLARVMGLIHTDGYLLSVSGEWDQVLDLPNGITYVNGTAYTGLDASGDYVTSGGTTTFAGNFCAQLTKSATPYTLDTANLRTRIKVMGTPTSYLSAYWDDLYDLGPFRTCFAILPGFDITAAGASGLTRVGTSVKTTGTSSQRLFIEFDNVFLGFSEYHATNGQLSEPVKFFAFGSAYLFGKGADGRLNGDLNAGLSVNGQLSLKAASACDGTGATCSTGRWQRGRLPTFTSTSPGNATTTILWSLDGVQRADFSNLNLTLSGQGGTTDTDRDDYGLEMNNSWKVAMPKIVFSLLGTAGVFHGNISSRMLDWYIGDNNAGLAFGDFSSGGDIPIWSSCLCETDAACGSGTGSCTILTSDSVYGGQFENIGLEANPFGELIFIDVGVSMSFNKIRSEGETAQLANGTGMQRHAIIFGAGQCGTEAGTLDDTGKTCGANSECMTTSACATSSTFNPGGTVTFMNSQLPDDGGQRQSMTAALCTAANAPFDCCTAASTGASCPNYDGVFLGEGTGNNVTSSINFISSTFPSLSTSDGTNQYPIGVSNTTQDGANLTQVIIDKTTVWPSTITKMESYKGYQIGNPKRYWFHAQQTDFSGDVNKCMPILGATPLVMSACTASAADIAAQGLSYAITNPPMYYLRGGCVNKSSTGWASGDKMALAIREIASGGASTAILGGSNLRGNPDYLYLPTTGTLSAWAPYTSAVSTPPQAFSDVGSTTAVGFQLNAVIVTDVTSNAVLNAMCWVDAVSLKGND